MGYVSEWFYMNRYKIGYADIATLKKKYPDQFLIFNGFRYVKESLMPEKEDCVISLQDEVRMKVEKLLKKYPSKISFCVAIAPKLGILPRVLRSRLFKGFKIAERPTARSLDLYQRILPILDEELKTRKEVEKATA